jgi:AmpD protein
LAILYPQAQLHPCEHFNPRPEGFAGEVSLLVIHNISLPAGYFGGGYISQLFAGTLASGDHPSFTELEGLTVSAHACIRRDGSVIQYVDFAQRAWHAGISTFQGRSGCNDYSIGIELEGTDTLPYTEAQYSALAHLSQFLIAQFPKITIGRIVGHNDIAPGRKTDPGVAFDWPRLRQSLDFTQSHLHKKPNKHSNNNKGLTA